MQKKLVVILGPTGVGKTNISMQLAQKFSCPIISADSRQIFKEIKIGTAAPSDKDLKKVKHYFIASHSIFETYSAGQYEEDVITLLENLYRSNEVVLLVGGSMMYIDAVCNGMDNIPSIQPEVREYWQRIFKEKGLDFIQSKLKEMDEKHYHKVDIKNPKRILHALEICTQTGKTYSEIRTGERKNRAFEVIKIGLNRPREELYANINLRVDEMMKEGLLQEAIPLFTYRHLNSLNTVGYKEIFEYIENKCTLEFAIDMIKQNSRRYAKRQLTWFNRDNSIHWFHPADTNHIHKYIEQEIKVE